jgi:hypothetical protein
VWKVNSSKLKAEGSKLSADYADYIDFNGAHIEQFYNLKNHL